MIPIAVEKLNQRGKEIYDLTLELMGIKSITGTGGVTEIGDFIYNYLQGWKYFQEHPEYLQLIPLPGDGLNRKNIMAFVKGEKGASPDTVVYLSHMDTVGIDDTEAVRQLNLPVVDIGI
jgi:arginine utilization protein RocB